MSTDRDTDEGAGGVADAARGREGRFRWRKSAAAAVPAVLAVGAMGVVIGHAHRHLPGRRGGHPAGHG